LPFRVFSRSEVSYGDSKLRLRLRLRPVLLDHVMVSCSVDGSVAFLRIVCTACT